MFCSHAIQTAWNVRGWGPWAGTAHFWNTALYTGRSTPPILVPVTIFTNLGLIYGGEDVQEGSGMWIKTNNNNKKSTAENRPTFRLFPGIRRKWLSRSTAVQDLLHSATAAAQRAVTSEQWTRNNFCMRKQCSCVADRRCYCPSRLFRNYRLPCYTYLQTNKHKVRTKQYLWHKNVSDRFRRHQSDKMNKGSSARKYFSTHIQ